MFAINTIQSDLNLFRKKLVDDISLQNNLREINNRKSKYNLKFIDYNPLSTQNLENKLSLNFDSRPLRPSVDSKDYRNEQLYNKIKSISTRSTSNKFLMPPKKPSGRLSPIGLKIKKENERISNENVKFFNKLIRVHSPFSKKKMDEHYKDFKETRTRLSKVRPFNLSNNSLIRSGSVTSLKSFHLPSTTKFTKFGKFSPSRVNMFKNSKY